MGDGFVGPFAQRLHDAASEGFEAGVEQHEAVAGAEGDDMGAVSSTLLTLPTKRCTSVSVGSLSAYKNTILLLTTHHYTYSCSLSHTHLHYY